MLEVFGEHTLGAREIVGLLVLSLALLAGYWIHAKSLAFPLLQLSLFRIRTFRASVSGSFFTRLGIGGVPFLLPLLYQVGLGLTPIQSGLLIMPQALAAMSMKFLMLRLLARFGYRNVLISNTVLIGILLFVFATIGVHTPIWVIVLQAFLYGTFTSLQYTSMNTLVYADTTEEETSAASSIASTVQQLSISFGVAAAGLATAFFHSPLCISIDLRRDDPWRPRGPDSSRSHDDSRHHRLQRPQTRRRHGREPSKSSPSGRMIAQNGLSEAYTAPAGVGIASGSLGGSIVAAPI